MPAAGGAASGARGWRQGFRPVGHRTLGRVLKIHVVRPDGHLYYLGELTPDRDGPVLAAGESPGRWSGAGAEALGMSGAVDAPGFGEVLDGRHPGTGRDLRARSTTRGVSGYDLTFCAPKSVSLLHLLAPGEIAGQVGAGHDAAVGEVLSYLQRTALAVRRRTRDGGRQLLPTTGAVSASFVHRTSRDLDPHLHTHLVVANLAHGVDGRWSAVDSRRIFAHARSAQGIYHARLRMELRDRIGAAWDVPANGLGDVVGVDRTLRRLFSQRTAAIDRYVADRAGRPGGPRRLDVAAHATRPDKDRTRTLESLRAEWAGRAAEFGFDLGDLTRVVGRAPAGPESRVFDGDRVGQRLDELASARRSLARRDVVAVLADAAPGGIGAGMLEAVADRVLASAGETVPGSGSGRGSTRPAVGSGVREPRWPADGVARVLDREPAVLLAGVIDRRATVPPAPGRGPRIGRGRHVRAERGISAPGLDR